jgi:hypothetical protein
MEINRLDKNISFEILLFKVWSRKWLCVFVTMVFVLMSIFYINTANRLYRVSVVLFPASDGQKSSPLSGISLLSGISTSENVNFRLFQKILLSTEIAKKIADNKDIMKIIYAKEWNAETENWQKPADSIFTKFLKNIRRIIINGNVSDYTAPNAARLLDFLEANISLEDEGGFLTIYFISGDPEFGRKLLGIITEEGNKFIQKRQQSESIAAIEFYKSRISQISSVEHRASLISLLTEEEKKLMMSSMYTEYAAKTLIGPTNKDRPISPNANIVLLLSTLSGIIASILLIIFPLFINNMRAYLSNELRIKTEPESASEH